MNAPASFSNHIKIRCSALTLWPDCERRAACRLFPSIVESKGFQLRTTGIHVGAPIGTGVHAGAAYGLQAKIDTGELAPLCEAMEVSMLGLDKAIEEVPGEVEYKRGVAVNRNEAQKQVSRMLAMVHTRLSPMINPSAVEDHLEADIGDGFVLSGHRDMYGIEVAPLEPGVDLMPGGWKIKDLKTSAHMGSHMPQTGGYGILGRSHGNRVDGADILHVPRVSLKKTQPDPIIIPVNIEAAERAAEATYQRTKSSLIAFMETGDPHVFLANPFSKLCNESCPAWGTEFCHEHLEIE